MLLLFIILYHIFKQNSRTSNGRKNLVTKFGDLFGCLGFLNAIKVIKWRESYAKYGEKTAKSTQNTHFRYFANPTLGAAIFS